MLLRRVSRINLMGKSVNYILIFIFVKITLNSILNKISFSEFDKRIYSDCISLRETQIILLGDYSIPYKSIDTTHPPSPSICHKSLFYHIIIIWAKFPIFSSHLYHHDKPSPGQVIQPSDQGTRDKYFLEMAWSSQTFHRRKVVIYNCDTK